MLRVLLLVTALLLLAAAPAAAHEGAEHAGPDLVSDLRSEVVRADLPPGISLEVLENGLALRLRNESAAVVSVLRRDGGERLRVPPGGQAQWHEDAAHPAGTPGPWWMVLAQDGRRHVVSGAVRLVPGPAPWPWLAAGLAVAVGLAVLARRRPDGVLALAVAASAVHAAVVLAARTAAGPRLALLGGDLPQLACWALALLAVLLLRGQGDGMLLGLLAAAGLLLLGITCDARCCGPRPRWSRCRSGWTGCSSCWPRQPPLPRWQSCSFTRSAPEDPLRGSPEPTRRTPAVHRRAASSGLRRGGRKPPCRAGVRRGPARRLCACAPGPPGRATSPGSPPRAPTAHS